MKKYNITWRDTREISVDILAKSKEEARQKWEDGEWEDKDIEVNDQDVLSEMNGGCFEIVEENSDETNS